MSLTREQVIVLLKQTVKDQRITVIRSGGSIEASGRGLKVDLPMLRNANVSTINNFG